MVTFEGKIGGAQKLRCGSHSPLYVDWYNTKGGGNPVISAVHIHGVDRVRDHVNYVGGSVPESSRTGTTNNYKGLHNEHLIKNFK